MSACLACTNFSVLGTEQGMHPIKKIALTWFMAGGAILAFNAQGWASAQLTSARQSIRPVVERAMEAPVKLWAADPHP
jgi:hypothetical protein